MTRRTNLLSKLNVHIAIVAVLLILDLFLTTRVILAWHESHSDTSSQYQADLAAYAQLQTKSARLRALPSELAASRNQAGAFIDARIPDNDSAILAELGALKDANHVVLSQSHYSYRPAIPGLVELRIEAGLSGQYAPIMHFINGLERDRDHAYFTIRSITLSGQQGGLVNLRIAITTYMRSTPAETNALRQNTRDAGQEAQ
jgi:type IV pilus assembly protein PilO